MKKMIKYFIFILTIISCNSPKLDGHYHVEWDNRSSFQTWNIKNNRMRINDSVCSNKKQSCYGMPIKFKGDSIFVPWFDFIYAAKFKILKNGAINLDGYSNSKLKLVPKENCISSEDYLNKKVKKTKSSFNLVSLYYNTHGISAFPVDSENELIIGKKRGIPFYILNNKLLKFSNNSFSIGNLNKSKDIWIYIDSKVLLKEVIVITKELTDKGYKIHFSSKDERENNEQIIIFKKSITDINQKNNSTIINTCEYCEKYPKEKIDSILKFKIFAKDSCLVNNKITDYFQLRNFSSRFLKQNRTTRLNTEIQLEINSNILFEDYLYLLSDIEFLNTDLSSISYYYGENDPDQKKY